MLPALIALPRLQLHAVNRRNHLPAAGSHVLQRVLAGHAPQRNKQRQWRRDQLNEELELGRVLKPRHLS